MMRLTGTAVNSTETVAGIPTKVEIVRLDKHGKNLIVRACKWAVNYGADIQIRHVETVTLCQATDTESTTV